MAKLVKFVLRVFYHSLKRGKKEKEEQQAKSYPDQALFPSILAWTFCSGSLTIGNLEWMWLV